MSDYELSPLACLLMYEHTWSTIPVIKMFNYSALFDIIVSGFDVFSVSLCMGTNIVKFYIPARNLVGVCVAGIDDILFFWVRF